ncbi:MAG TPA: hypothetical protein VJ456_17755 [Acidimicrobiia bacterium]|nr:hypothetical protein [Acidimicrobiia bacterium]
MSRRGWWSAVIGIALTAGVAVPVGLATPAGAAETTFTETCADVYGHRSMGDLDKTTDPVPGSAVTPGQELAVTLHWPTFAVAGTRAHRLLECLSIDRGAPQTWVDRQFTTSEGTTTLSEVVPTGLAPRTTVCGQSFLKTQGSFGPVTRWSEKTCYPVGGAGSFHAMSRSPSPPSASAPSPPPSPQNRSTPTTRGPYVSPPPSPPSGSGEYQAPWPPWEKAPRVSASPPPLVTTTSTTAPKSTTTAPRKAAGTQAAAPATRKSTGSPGGTLPRTGAGVVVLLGIAAVALFSGRTLRKASDHIADSLPVPAVPIDEDEEPTLILGRRW